MFQVNDSVVYGNYGICTVKAIGSLEIPTAARGRVYYTLEPLLAQKNTIYTPVDNEKSSMRPALTKEEVSRLLEEIPDVDPIGVEDDKKREDQYKEIMKRNDCRGWLQIIKTLYSDKRLRMAQGKKSTVRDELYLKLAEDFLFREFAVALGADKEAVRDLVIGKIKESVDERPL